MAGGSSGSLRALVRFVFFPTRTELVVLLSLVGVAQDFIRLVDLLEFLLGVLVVLAFWIFTVYNGLVAMRQRVDHAFADIDVQLKQRHDLIPNLVETVKGYASHERGTLDDVIKARNSAMSAQGPAQVSAAEAQLSGALGRLIALSEAYPDLKANANFQQLASELSDLENKIAASRRFFNNAVQEYNTGIQQLPAALFAGMFGFTRKEFFDLGASRTEV